MQVTITIHNSTHLKIVAHYQVLKTISERFRFRANNFMFSPKFKQRIWDGYIRLFDAKKGLLPFGLLQDLLVLCVKEDYEVVLDKELKDYVAALQKETTDISQTLFNTVEQLNVHAHGEKIEPYDYQMLAVQHCVDHPRAIILSPTSTGKSLIIYLLSLLLLYNKLKDEETPRILIVVPNVSLVEQLLGDFKDYSSANNVDVDRIVQIIYEGQSKKIARPITISTWQSLIDFPPEWFEKFHAVICDECHRVKAKVFKHIVASSTNAWYKYGFTGSLQDSEVDVLDLVGSLGPVFETITYAEAMEAKYISNIDIQCLSLSYGEDFARHCKKLSYIEEIMEVIKHPKRIDFISTLTTHLSGNTLVLFRYIEHGMMLFEKIKSKTREAYYVDGKTDAKTRELYRTMAENRSHMVLVCSYGTFSTGINIRNLHNIIFASPVKSEITTLQSIGRGLRLHESKERVKLFDIADDLRHKSYVNFAYRHMLERVRIYNERGFAYRVKAIDLSDK